MLERYTAPYDAKETDKLLDNVDKFLTAAIEKTSRATFEAVKLPLRIVVNPEDYPVEADEGWSAARQQMESNYHSFLGEPLSDTPDTLN